MTQITSFTNSSLRIIDNVLQAKLKRVSEEMKAELGVEVNLASGGSYGSNEYKPKLSITLDGVDPLKEDFRAYCTMFGLKQSDFGKTFIDGLNEFKIVGLLPSRRKYPVLCKNTRTNKEILYTAYSVKDLL